MHAARTIAVSRALGHDWTTALRAKGRHIRDTHAAVLGAHRAHRAMIERNAVRKQRQPPWQISGSFVELQLTINAASHSEPISAITSFDMIPSPSRRAIQAMPGPCEANRALGRPRDQSRGQYRVPRKTGNSGMSPSDKSDGT